MQDNEYKEFSNPSLTQIKNNVLEAARRTRKNGLTPYSIAAWEKFKFNGEEIGIAVGRTLYSSGGIGGKIVIKEIGNQHYSVNVIWENSDPGLKNISEHFWQNLNQIIEKGGFTPQPRSIKSLIAGILIIVLTIWSVIMMTGSIIILRDTPLEYSNLPFLVVMISAVVVVFGIVSSIFCFKRSGFYLVLTFPIAILFFWGIFFPLILDSWEVPNGLTGTLFGLAIAVIVFLLLTKKEYI
jgi:hypothetical protein